MSNFVVRPLVPKEIDVFYPLFATVVTEDFPEYKPQIDRICLQIDTKAYYRGLYKKNEGVLMGAFDGEELAGFLVITKDIGGVGHFKWLGVEKLHRKQGIASALLAAGEQWLLENKFHHLYFHTENMKNVEFYKRRGYEFVGLRKNSWFGVDEYLMQKQLRNTPFEEVFAKYK